jgi:hypothetical protein
MKKELLKIYLPATFLFLILIFGWSGGVLFALPPETAPGVPGSPSPSPSPPPATPPPAPTPAGGVKNFTQPAQAPPAESIPLFLNIGSLYQQKAGELGANVFYLVSLGKFAHEAPKIKIKSATQSSGRVAEVLCDEGYKVISCSGSRDANVIDGCPEDQCGFVGVVPIDKTGKTSVSTAPGDTMAVGCKAGARNTGGALVTVYAYCMCNQATCP